MRPTMMHSAVLFSAMLALAVPAQGIVGGSPADEAEYPWLGYLSADYLLLGSACGGSLVAPDVFVTAAHCVEGLLPLGNELLNPFLQSVSVHLGSNEAGAGERIRASEIHIHPDYDGDHDIAVLILERPSSQQPIAWAQPGDESLYAPGTIATVAGWGATSEGGSSSSQLLEVDLPIISDTDCAAYYGSRTDGSSVITSQKLAYSKLTRSQQRSLQGPVAAIKLFKSDVTVSPRFGRYRPVTTFRQQNPPHRTLSSVINANTKASSKICSYSFLVAPAGQITNGVLRKTTPGTPMPTRASVIRFQPGTPFRVQVVLRKG